MKNITKLFVFAVMIVSMSLVTLAAPGFVDVSDSAGEVEFSENTEIFSDNGSQDGTVTNPYLISSPADFNKYAKLVNDNNSTYASLNYKLVSNVDFTNESLVPFGTESAPFKGTIDGNGFALLNVTLPENLYSGVVGYMTLGTIKNLRVEYADITLNRNSTTEKYYFGGILGRGVVESGETITISGCQTRGNVTVTSPTAVYAAGVVAALDSKLGNTVISNCLADMKLNITSEKNCYLAGFAAYVQNGSTNKDCVIKNCVSLGDVSLETTGYEATAGSFAAYVQKDEDNFSGWAGEDVANLASEGVKHFENCVALGNVSAKAKTRAKAGIFYSNKAGDGTFVMSNCYSSNEQTASAQSSSPVTASNSGTKLDADSFKENDFYKNTLCIDLDNNWYLTNSGSLGLRTAAKSYGAAVALDKKDVRLTSNPGIRFRSEIETSKKDYVFEYGFIAARKEALGSQELTLDFEGKKAVGVAYSSQEGIDKFLSKGDTLIEFSAVIVNIKEQYYSEEFSVRTYVKFISEGETVVVYGDTVTSSINASALAVRLGEGYEYLTDEQKAILDTMLPA